MNEAALVEAMARRRKSPDVLLARALSVLGDMVDASPMTPRDLEAGETFSARLTAVAKAVGALNKVENDRWGRWSPRRLRELSDDELAAELDREAKRKLHAAPGGAN